MLYFSEVDFIDLYTVNWNVQYNQNNQTYRMLISICYLVVKGLLQTQSDGSTKLMDFLDEQRMCRLYEKFILEYYRREFKNQIFTYVKNKEYELREKDHTVSGMLLYAKTDEEIYPNNVYQMSGNQITVRTLDLNLPFTEIAEQLDTIAKLHFSL